MYIFWVILFFISSTIVVATATKPPAQNNLESDTEVEDVGELIHQGPPTPNNIAHEALILVESSIDIVSTRPFSGHEKAALFEQAFTYQDTSLQKRILYLCPAEEQSDIAYLQQYSNLIVGIEYCLFKKIYQGTKKMCLNQVKPVLKIDIHSDDTEKCDKSGRKLYSFGFYNCHSLETLRLRMTELDNRRVDLYINESPRSRPNMENVYQVCMDTNSMRTIWTKHMVSLPRTSANTNSQPIQSLNWNEISIEPYNLENQSFELLRNVFIERESQMVMQMMVPQEHLPPNLWKQPTKHIINMAPLSPQFVPLMHAINQGIRKAAIIIKSQSPVLNLFINNFSLEEKYDLDVYTTTRQTTNGPNQIHDNFNIWCKLVYYKEKKLAILIFLHNTPDIKHGHLKKYCNGVIIWGKKVTCDFTTWTDTKKELKKLSHYAYCCEASPRLIQQFFSIRLEVQGVFKIQSIIRGKTKTLKKLRLTGRQIRTQYGTEIEKVINEL